MNWKFVIICPLLILFVVESGSAFPFRRRRSSNSGSSYGQNYDEQYRQLPKSSAVYDWDSIAKIDAADHLPIVLNKPINGKLEVQLTCLSNSAETFTIEAQLVNGQAKVKHETIKPGTMYRLCAAINGKERIPGPYFTATSGDSVEARGRRKIVVRYFEQYWRKENGHSYYDSNCEAGYNWAIRPFASFTGFRHNGHHLASFDKSGMIHGDKCRSSSHTWMALAYDQHKKRIWCIDSNFNSTIMVIQRQSSGWSVGHLTPASFSKKVK